MGPILSLTRGRGKPIARAMKTALRSLSFLLLAAAGVLSLGAAPEAPTAGKFLVLRNGRTLEGDVERVGEQYRVRRNGGETWIAANLVLRLFRDTEDAYQFLRARTDLDDAADRLRLAKWCLGAGLRERALEEAAAAERLRPKDAEMQRFLERLRQPTPQPSAAPPAPPDRDPEPPAPPVDLTPEALGQFTRKVQPILLNACAGCHNGDRGGPFKLTKTSDVAALNRKASQENLAAVLAQVKLDQPQASPLLTKAVTVHGGGDKAPLGGRQAVAYRALEDWVKGTLANNPQLQDRLVAAPPETKPAFADVKPDAPRAAVTPPAHAVPITPVPSAAPPPTVNPPDNGDDAYDPSEFNRQAHPERDKAPPPKP
jgi:hypothetical protein